MTATLLPCPLVERLKDAMRRVADMCREHRGPQMRIPARPDDDDIFICNTIREAIAELDRRPAPAGKDDARPPTPEEQRMLKHALIAASAPAGKVPEEIHKLARGYIDGIGNRPHHLQPCTCDRCVMARFILSLNAAPQERKADTSRTPDSEAPAVAAPRCTCTYGDTDPDCPLHGTFKRPATVAPVVSTKGSQEPLGAQTAAAPKAPEGK